MTHRGWISDGAGLLGASICLVHCTLLPLLAALFPVITLTTDALWVHGALLIMVVPAGIFAFARGYPVHRRAWVPAVGAAGLILVTTGTLMGLGGQVWLEVGLILAGCAALLPSHWANWRSSTSQAMHPSSVASASQGSPPSA